MRSYSMDLEQDFFLDEIATYMTDTFIDLEDEQASLTTINAILGTIFDVVSPEYRAEVYVKFVNTLQDAGYNISNSLFVVD